MNFRFLIAMLIIALPTLGHATAYSSTAACSTFCNFSTAASWSPSGKPGTGDTVTIGAGHNVRITKPGTVIGSDSATYAVTISGTGGSLAINADTTIYAAGISMSGASSALTVAGGVTVTLATATANNCLIYMPNANTGKTVTIGDGINLTTIQGTATGTGYVQLYGGDTTAAGDAVWTFHNVKLSGLGKATTAAFNKCRNLAWHNVLINDCGPFTSGNTDDDFTLDINGMDIRNSKCSGTAYWTYVNGLAKTAKPRTIQNVTFVSSATTNAVNIPIADLALSGIVSEVNINSLYSGHETDGKRQRWDNVVFITPTAQGTSPVITTAMNADNRYSRTMFMRCFDSAVGTRTNNVHSMQDMISFDAASGPNYWHNSLVDGLYRNYIGDQIMNSGDWVIENNVGIRAFGNMFDGYNSAGGATGRVWVRNNTVHDATGDSESGSGYAFIGGMVVSEGTGNATATRIAELRNNLFTETHHGLCMSSYMGPWVRQSDFTVSHNGYWNIKSAYNVRNSSGVATYLAMPSTSQTGGVGTRITLGATTVTTAVNAYTVVVSGANFITAGVQSGDFLVDTTNPAIPAAVIQSVDGETQVTLGYGDTGARGIPVIASGHTIAVVPGWWATGVYGDTNKGSNDVNVNPLLYDPTRNTETFDAAFGGDGTITHLRNEMLKINGWDRTGTPATYNDSFSPFNLMTWVRQGYAPVNPAYIGTGYGGANIGADVTAGSLPVRRIRDIKQHRRSDYHPLITHPLLAALLED